MKRKRMLFPLNYLKAGLSDLLGPLFGFSILLPRIIVSIKRHNITKTIHCRLMNVHCFCYLFVALPSIQLPLTETQAFSPYKLHLLNISCISFLLFIPATNCFLSLVFCSSHHLTGLPASTFASFDPSLQNVVNHKGRFDLVTDFLKPFSDLYCRCS